MGGAFCRGLDVRLDPLALFRVLDVHVLDADRAAIRVAQHAEDLAQPHDRLAAEPAGRELALQVPQRQAVLDDVQVRVLALHGLDRVGVGHQVAADPVGVDQFLHAGRPGDVVLVAVREVLDPADRLVGDAQALEDAVVEAVLAEQQLVDDAQEVAGLSSLDDPVVVRGSQRHRLADGEPGHGLLARALVGGGVLHGADADDRALARHEAWHRVLGADRARVSQGDRGALEVSDRQLAAAGLADHVLVGGPELAEVHLLGALDVGYQELAAAVLGLQVDGQAEVHVVRHGEHRLAVFLGERGVHLRERLDRLDQRVADEVGEGDLPAPAALQVVVDDDPVVDEQLGRHGADARSRGHAEAGHHVLRGAGGRAAQLVHVRVGGRRGGRRGGCRSGGSGWRACRSGLGRGLGRWRGGRLRQDRLGTGTVDAPDRPVVGEERPPCLVDRTGVGEVTLVQLVD